MEKGKDAKIINHFSSITDPRIEKKSRHKLIDIIAITICAITCGADTWTDVANYGCAKQDWLKKFLELPNGIPSHDTFGRIFSMIDIEEFQHCFLSWVQSVFDVTDNQVIAIDGKTLRGSYDRASNKAPIHMINAWASKNGITLGQMKTDEKSNEIKAIPKLLKLLEIKNCIVTIDAIGCQKEIAEKISKKEADYVLALKNNQKNLYNDVKMFFQEAHKNGFKDIPFAHHKTVDGDHGRIETREYWITEDIQWLQGKENWKNLKSVGMVRSHTEIGEKTRNNTRYYLCSINSDAKRFANASRRHWGVENSVHWLLDVAFKEDNCRIRKDNAPANISALRNMTLNMLKQEKTAKVGIEAKRKRAGWDDDYLFKVLNL